MERSQSIGTLLMVASGLQMLIFTLGMLRKSYLAVALPVFAATAGASAILFWIGYTMAQFSDPLTVCFRRTSHGPDSRSAFSGTFG